MLSASARAFDASGVQGMRRTALRIGGQGWVYGAPGRSGTVNVVVWRYDRVYAGVGVWGVTKARAIAMARTQQRRIAAALGWRGGHSGSSSIPTPSATRVT